MNHSLPQFLSPPFPAKGWKGFKRVQEVHLLANRVLQKLLWKGKGSPGGKRKQKYCSSFLVISQTCRSSALTCSQTSRRENCPGSVPRQPQFPCIPCPGPRRRVLCAKMQLHYYCHGQHHFYKVRRNILSLRFLPTYPTCLLKWGQGLRAIIP